ncbi:hypothetical protein RMCBS344292_16201 [Rhizopus microsporus]|nr:hypothetical protein RMCBS344292_16201 [Rhizopus microsporus]
MAFHHTNLKEYLLSKQIDTVIVVGMMIHNCNNATTYSSTDEGFKSIVVAVAVNTMDQQIFGEMIPAETIWKSFLAGIAFAYASTFFLLGLLHIQRPLFLQKNFVYVLDNHFLPVAGTYDVVWMFG